MFPWENVVRVPFRAEVPETPLPRRPALGSVKQHGVMERALCLEHDDISSSPRFPAVLGEWPLDSLRLSFFICQAGKKTPTSLGFSELKGNECLQNHYESCQALYSCEERTVTVQSVRMWAPSWKWAFTSQGSMAKVPGLSMEMCLLLPQSCPGDPAPKASTLKLHELQDKEN